MKLLRIFFKWFTETFDKTDFTLIVGLFFFYYALDQSEIPGWLPGSVIGAVFVGIACLGYWRS